MMRIALEVRYEDGAAVKVTAAAPDLIAFERHFDKPMAVFASDVRIEWLLWLAWTTLKRQGKTGLEFDPWTATVSEIVFGDQEEATVPPLEEPTTPTS